MKKKYPKIETEAQYWEELKKFKKEIWNYTKRVGTFAKKPTEYINDFKDLMYSGVERELITKEFADQQITKFLNELNSPSRFKEDVKNFIIKAKAKFRKK
jgi:hypothetical protein